MDDSIVSLVISMFPVHHQTRVSLGQISVRSASYRADGRSKTGAGATPNSGAPAAPFKRTFCGINSVSRRSNTSHGVVQYCISGHFL
jgi:hypothetical protein